MGFLLSSYKKSMDPTSWMTKHVCFLLLLGVFYSNCLILSFFCQRFGIALNMWSIFCFFMFFSSIGNNNYLCVNVDWERRRCLGYQKTSTIVCSRSCWSEIQGSTNPMLSFDWKWLSHLGELISLMWAWTTSLHDNFDKLFGLITTYLLFVSMILVVFTISMIISLFFQSMNLFFLIIINLSPATSCNH